MIMSSTENSHGTLTQPLFSAVVSVTEGTPHLTREGKQLNNNSNNNNNINKFKEEPNGKQKNQNNFQQENGNNINLNINIKEEPSGKQKNQNNSQQENIKSNVNISTTGRNQQIQVYQNCDPNDITADVDAQFINPISFLNTMHQKLKTTAPPEYSFSHDSVTGQFYCQVHFCGQTYQNQIAKPKKQTAKEEVACIAMRDLTTRMPDITNQIRAELIRAHISSQKSKFGGNKKPVGNNINNINNNNVNNNNGMNGINGINRQPITLQMRPPHPLELVPKSRQWYDKQQQQAANNRQKKRPCVLLLEFCQMHKLGHPVYNIRDDGRGNYLFDCTINDRTFTPDVAFWQKNDAKDHVSTIAFNVLFKEICERELMEIQYRHPHFQPPPPPPPPLPPLPHNQQPHIGVPTYGNVMAMYPPNDAGYIANNMSLVPANYVFTNNGNNGQNHALIPRNS